MIDFTLPSASLPFLFLLSLFSGTTRRLLFYYNEKLLWMKKYWHSYYRWTLVPRPADGSVVDCRWVYSIKYKSNGSVDRYKARLVARGFTQTFGVDYAETFLPVTILSSICVLVSVVINKSWDFYQLDVRNAFLYGDL